MDVMVLVLVSVPFSLSFPLLFLGQSLTNMMGRADIFHKLNARSKDGADVHSHVHSHMYWKDTIGIHWTIEKARQFQKNIYFCFIDYAKAFDHVDTANCGKFLKSWEYQTTWPASWESCMQVRKQHFDLDMEQQTGSKYKKEYVKAVYCHCAYLTYMQSTSWETLGWMKQKLASRLLGEISITSYKTPALWQEAKNQSASWWRWKRSVKKLA